MNIKAELASLGMTQVELILELQSRGLSVSPPMLSSILRGVYTYPKAKAILHECEVVIDEHKRRSI